MPNFCLLADVWDLQTSTNYSYYSFSFLLFISSCHRLFICTTCFPPLIPWNLNVALYMPCLAHTLVDFIQNKYIKDLKQHL